MNVMTPTRHWERMLASVPSAHLSPTSLGMRASLYSPGIRDRYLEVGCRMGHSLGMALADNDRRAVVVDCWVPNYADESNYGPAAVRSNLRRWGLNPDRVSFFTADSQALLPLLASEQFDTILIDGDHTPAGAARDIREGLRLLAPGGVLLFDDADVDLMPVWRTVLKPILHRYRTTEILSETHIPYCTAVRL